MSDYKRAVARKLRISDITSGRYVKDDGDLPSYIVTDSGETVSRVNVIAILVSKNDDGSAIMDDGSGKVQLRSFNGKLNADVGDFVLVIGRPREFGERYISAEVVKKVDKEWADLRKKELSSQTAIPPAPKNPEERNTDFVLNVIRNLDKGDGAPYDAIIKSTNDDNVGKVLSMLMEQGSVFEIRPGRLKVLE